MTVSEFSKQHFFEENQFDSVESINSNKELLGLIFVIRRILHNLHARDEKLINSFFTALIIFINYMGLTCKSNKWSLRKRKNKKEITLDKKYFQELIGIDISKDLKEIMTDISIERAKINTFSIEYYFRFFEGILNYNDTNFSQEEIKQIVKALQPYIDYCQLQLNYRTEHEDGRITNAYLDAFAFNTLDKLSQEIYLKNHGELIMVRNQYAYNIHLYELNNFFVEIEYHFQEIKTISIFNPENFHLYQKHIDNIYVIMKQQRE